MNTIPFKPVVLALTIAAFAPASFAQLVIPSDGSDGALNFTNGTTVIDLSQAVSGVWTNASTVPGKGFFQTSIENTRKDRGS
jgi:hypothetical protein